MKNKKIVVANWKMNPTTEQEAKKIFLGIKRAASKLSNIQTIVCPPFIYLNTLNKLYKGHRIAIGAQDVFEKKAGSFTGEISLGMLKLNDVEYVILGHSERRALGESSELVNEKIKLVLKSGLNVILCVGELERSDHGEHFGFLKDQILNSLKGINKNYLKNILIAYEPVWAISGNSGNKATTSENIHEMVIFIKKVLSDKYGAKNTLPKILYGGSVNPKNIEDLMLGGNTDGFLVGAASLDAEKFNYILKITAETK